jgi:hypothetical protein
MNKYMLSTTLKLSTGVSQTVTGKRLLFLGVMALWLSTYLAQMPILLDVLFGGEKTNPGGLGSLAYLLVLGVQIPGIFVADWFSLTDTHLCLEWVVTILANALLYMLLSTLLVSLYSWGIRTAAWVPRAARVSFLGLVRVCWLFFVINLASTIFLCFNTKSIEFFDSESPHTTLVAIVNALSLSLGGTACWWCHNRTKTERGLR